MSNERNGASRLWALRHGESRANREGVIVSRPGTEAFFWAKLTELGREQAAAGARANPLAADALVITSDFARARETAEIAAEIWGTGAPRVDTRLRERDFGSLEGGSSALYDGVWAADTHGSPLPPGVETPAEVALRTRSLVEELLRAHAPSDIVLVAHGDVLQIAEAWLRGMTPTAHRTLPHLRNAELRLLTSMPARSSSFTQHPR